MTRSFLRDSVCFAALALLTCTALAQDPGSGSEAPPEVGVVQPEAPVEPGSAFEIVSSGGARTRAIEFVASKGWSEGWDVDKGWGVWIGEASLTAADPTGLALAMQGAQLDAKFQFAEYLAGVTSSYTLSLAEKNPAQRKAESDRLSKMAEGSGGDPVAAGIRDLLSLAPDRADPNVAFQSRITTASKTTAQAAIPGMITVATFVETTKDGLDGTAAVVLVSTPRSRQLADALLGRGPVPIGEPGMPLKDYVNALSPEALVYSCGATYRRNEKGQLCLLGFGVGPVEGPESEELRSAQDEARQAATADIRNVAGELIEGGRLILRAAQKTKLIDGTIKSESSRSVTTRMTGIAKGLSLPGVTDVDVKRVRHPVLGELMCVVRQWNLSGAENAAYLGKVFEEQGGWRGGEGVQPGGRGTGGGNAVTPVQPRKPGVPSGSGGGGIDEDA